MKLKIPINFGYEMGSFSSSGGDRIEFLEIEMTEKEYFSLSETVRSQIEVKLFLALKETE